MIVPFEPYEVGEPVWVFRKYIPQKSSPKLMRAWRGPQKVAPVLLEGRVYILDTGQKVPFEQLKPHHSGLTEWAAVPAHNGEVSIIMDPDQEQSQEEVPDDASRPSYREEEPQSAASDVSPPSRQRHWMDTRLRTRVRAGDSRLYYQQFDYSSTDSDDDRSDVLLSSAQVNPNESAVLTPSRNEPAPNLEVPISPLPAMEALFSENEAVPDTGADTQKSPSHTLANNAGTSLTGTSAPLMTNPSLTDMLSNFPIWPQIDSIPEIRDDNVESPPSHDDEEPFPVTTLPGDGTSTMAEPTRVPEGQQECRLRRRPPKGIKPRASRLYDYHRKCLRGNTRKRSRPRSRPPRIPPIGQGKSAGLRNITSVDTDSSAPSAAITSDQEPPPGSTNTRYGLRRNRTPRCRCGTFGLLVCKCNNMIHANFPVKIPGSSVDA